MTRATDPITTGPIAGKGNVVRRPMASDAIGTALMCAFSPRQSIPADLAAALANLETIS